MAAVDAEKGVIHVKLPSKADDDDAAAVLDVDLESTRKKLVATVLENFPDLDVGMATAAVDHWLKYPHETPEDIVANAPKDYFLASCLIDGQQEPHSSSDVFVLDLEEEEEDAVVQCGSPTALEDKLDHPWKSDGPETYPAVEVGEEGVQSGDKGRSDAAVDDQPAEGQVHDEAA